MTLFSMANLAGLVGDYREALNNAADARDMFGKAGKDNKHCTKLLEQLSENIKKIGITHEKNGKFSEAIDYFKMAIPFADTIDEKAMKYEIDLLQGYMNE